MLSHFPLVRKRSLINIIITTSTIEKKKTTQTSSLHFRFKVNVSFRFTCLLFFSFFFLVGDCYYVYRVRYSYLCTAEVTFFLCLW